MSIEKTIEANTAAMIALTLALNAHTAALGGTVAAAPQPKADAKPAGKPAEPAAAAQPAANAALDYEKDVKPLALRVAKEKGRDTLVSTLAKFAVAQANLLKPEQWGEFIKECNAALK